MHALTIVGIIIGVKYLEIEQVRENAAALCELTT